MYSDVIVNFYIVFKTRWCRQGMVLPHSGLAWRALNFSLTQKTGSSINSTTGIIISGRLKAVKL